MRIIRIALFLTISSTIFALLAYFVAVPVAYAAFMPDEIRLSLNEVENHQNISPHKNVVGVYDGAVPANVGSRTWVDLKLFNKITIKRVSVEILEQTELVAGGIPIGFVAKTDGVVVTKSGGGYKKGDVIKELDSAIISSVGDLERHLGKRKLGVWVKDDTSGVGTLTYINPQNNNFSALGHKLVDNETGALVNLRSGDVYACNVVGIERSTRKRVGTIESTLKRGVYGVQGNIISSNNYGIFGCLNDGNSIIGALKTTYPVASRYSVRLGAAKILCSLDGDNVEAFDIDIIKARNQKTSADKGLVFRVTDKRLLAATGGIVHGMSGSPIIQNGNIIGAVTHVITNDVTKGYGIYIDFVVP
jgi:hypothetical protein